MILAILESLSNMLVLHSSIKDMTKIIKKLKTEFEMSYTSMIV